MVPGVRPGARGRVDAVRICLGMEDSTDDECGLGMHREGADRFVVDGDALARVCGFNGPFATDDLRSGVCDRCQSHGDRLQNEELEGNSSSFRFAGAAVRRHSEPRL
jgi:hypothetical protein